MAQYPGSEVVLDAFYLSLGYGDYAGGSPLYPVAVWAATGDYLYSKTQNSQADEIRFYTIGYDSKGNLEMNFFVSKIDSTDKEDFSSRTRKWWDNQEFFQSLEDYLDYSFAVRCK